jgi:hypothetical protein
MDTYNGWKNRSTWLVKLHLDNDDAEIASLAVDAAVQANTVGEYRNKVLSLIVETNVSDEQAFDMSEVDFMELWDNTRLV